MTSLAGGPDEDIGVLVVAQANTDEWRALKDEIKKLVSRDRLRLVDSIGAAPAADSAPDIVVVLQRHPDEFSAAQIDQLLRTFPLARLVVCGGPWCDSVGRTRDDWPPACRVRADEVLQRVHQEIEIVRGRERPLPLTANRDECWAADVSPAVGNPHSEICVAIESPDPDLRGWLTDAVLAAGMVCGLADRKPADLFLWDIDPSSEATLQRLAACRQQHPDTPIVGLSGYHRPALFRQLEAAGITRVISKLAAWHVLIDALREASSERTQAGTRAVPKLRIV